jgi:prepilin-type N-terminal cleavage/methylation domain-containing protein/prepilin-type processing-associated H-X9-DG protein
MAMELERMHAETPRHSRAFTMIELLVVVAIIALLVSILLPALGDAKRDASKTVCLTHMRGIVQALNMYMAEFNDTCPPNGVLFPKGPGVSPPAYLPFGDSNMQHWQLSYGAMYSRLNNQDKMFVCPDDVTSNMSRTIAGQLLRDPVTGTVSIYGGAGASGVGFWSYSVNTVLNSQGKFRTTLYNAGLPQSWNDPLKRVNIQSEQNFLYLIEEDTNSPFNDEVFDPPSFNGGDALTNRHNNGGNLGFADGHVDWMQAIPFNNVPASSPIASPFTRWFFPDGGAFSQ